MRKWVAALTVGLCVSVMAPSVASAYVIRDTYHDMIDDYYHKLKSERNIPWYQSSQSLRKEAEAYVVAVQSNRGQKRYVAEDTPRIIGFEIVGGDDLPAHRGSGNLEDLVSTKDLFELATLGPRSEAFSSSNIAQWVIQEVIDYELRSQKARQDRIILNVAIRAQIPLFDDDLDRLEKRVALVKDLLTTQAGNIPGTSVTWQDYFMTPLRYKTQAYMSVSYSPWELTFHAEELLDRLERNDLAPSTIHRLMVEHYGVTPSEVRDMVEFRSKVEAIFGQGVRFAVP